MKFCKTMIAGALWLAGATVTAQAQSPEQTRAEQPGLIRDAFASDYGKALVAELRKSLRANADPACLKSKAIPESQLEARGRDLIVKWGSRMMEGTTSVVDSRAWSEKFAASAGSDAVTEMERLKQDATVKRYLALVQPMRLAQIVSSTFEWFDRYVLVSKIKLAGVHPLGTGNEKLLSKDPTEAVEKKLEKFFDGTKSPALDRYLALVEKSATATKEAMKRDQIPTGGPIAYFKGVEADLAELCIGPKK